MAHGVKIAGRRQLTAGSKQNSEVKYQRSGIKLISDLRLLTSVINDLHVLDGQ